MQWTKCSTGAHTDELSLGKSLAVIMGEHEPTITSTKDDMQASEVRVVTGNTVLPVTVLS